MSSCLILSHIHSSSSFLFSGSFVFLILLLNSLSCFNSFFLMAFFLAFAYFLLILPAANNTPVGITTNPVTAFLSFFFTTCLDLLFLISRASLSCGWLRVCFKNSTSLSFIFILSFLSLKKVCFSIVFYFYFCIEIGQFFQHISIDLNVNWSIP